MVTSNRLKLAVAAAVLALLWLGMFIEGTGAADRALLAELYAGHRPGLANAARVLTFLGGGYWVTPFVAVIALALALLRRPRIALVLFVGNSLGRLLVELQKYELGRVRPDLNPHLVNVTSLSFPSAHSANAVMTYVAMALLLPAKPRLPWVIGASILALLIGLSRVMLGVHWPSDVIAGWSFGALWVLAMLCIAERVAVPAPPERA